MRHPDGLPAPEAISRRRSTRHFDPARPLDDDVLARIIRLGTLAPSSFNLQPWRFIVVRDARNRERLRACAFGQAKVVEAPAVLIVLGYLNPHRTDLDDMVDLRVALGAATPDQAAAMRGIGASLGRKVGDRTLWATRSAMLAAATILIAAESLGVASAPMEGLDEARVREAFGVPDDHAVCCLIALGYALEDEAFPGRFGLDRACFEEHFGQPWKGPGGVPSGDAGAVEGHGRRE